MTKDFMDIVYLIRLAIKAGALPAFHKERGKYVFQFPRRCAACDLEPYDFDLLEKWAGEHPKEMFSFMAES